MIDSEQHPYVEWIASEARRPVVTDQAARDRIMAAVRAEPVRSAPRRGSGIGSVEPHAFRLSPAGVGLIAAGLVGVGVLAGAFVNNRGGRSSAGPPQVAVVSPQLPVSDTVVKFVFVAPQAAKVSVVGDFNGWDSTKTPMARGSERRRVDRDPAPDDRAAPVFVRRRRILERGSERTARTR